MIELQPLTVVIDGQVASLGLDSANPLIRAVVISLFTWRRANPDDDLPGGSMEGWWGDIFPPVEDDRIGSRLWLLSRAKLLPGTPQQAKEYAAEALQWMIDDGVASRIDIVAERQGNDTLALSLVFYRSDGSALADIRFANLWEYLNV